MGRRKVFKFLVQGRLKELEVWLSEVCEKKPSYYKYLVNLYLETGNPQKAYEASRKYSIVESSEYALYLYLLCCGRLGEANLNEERRNLSKLLKHKKGKGLYLFLSGVANLILGNRERALRRFREAVEEGCNLGHWGIAEVLNINGDRELAKTELYKCIKLGKKFPPIYLLMGKLHTSPMKNIYYLERYIREMPVSSEANYELGMYLLEFSNLPLLGRFFKNKAIKHLQVKALLDSPRPENSWLYKLIALHCFQKGKAGKAAKWILIEQQVLYNTLSQLEKFLRENSNNNSEDLMDMIHSVVKVLTDKEIMTEEDFHRAYAEIRETRLLEKMYQLSEDENNEKDS